MAFLQRTMNRGSVSTGYDIDNSCKFEADNQEEFLRTPSSASNMKTWTVSLWFKRTELDTYQMLFGSSDTYMYFDTSNNVTINFRGASENFFLITNRKFRDTSAWYHFVVVCDFTNSTAADRGRLYVNGVRETSYSNSTYQNAHSGVNSYWNNTVAQSIGGQNASTTFQSSGYMAEVHSVDGTALDATSFGEFDEDSGIWKPKAYTGSYGTNGFYLDYSSAGDMGNDSSGNNNDFSPQNINQNDQATDTPTNNFATLNVLNRNSAQSGVTNNSVFTEGNTKITGNLNSYWQSGVANIGITSGKWYFEAKPYDSDTKICTIGYGDEADIENWGRSNNFPGASSSKSYGYAGGTTAGYGQISPSTNKPSPAVTYNQTNIIGVAIDADNGYVYWSKDGSYVNSGNPASGSSGTGGIAIPTGAGTNGTLLPAVGFYYDGTVPIMLVNFGGYTTISISSSASDENGYGNFEYAPPSGYYAICGKNLAEYGGSA